MKELAHRINFFAFSLIGVIGIAMASEIIREDDFPDKIDDFFLFILALAGIWWYQKRGYLSERISPAFIIVILAIITKILAIAIEYADQAAVGDDMGILVVLIVALIFLFIMKKKSPSITPIKT